MSFNTKIVTTYAKSLFQNLKNSPTKESAKDFKVSKIKGSNYFELNIVIFDIPI